MRDWCCMNGLPLYRSMYGNNRVVPDQSDVATVSSGPWYAFDARLSARNCIETMPSRILGKSNRALQSQGCVATLVF